jgi:hypothetical protein
MRASSTKNILAALKINKSNGLLTDIISSQNIKSSTLETSSNVNQEQQDDGTKFSALTLTLKPPTSKEIKKFEKLKSELKHSQKKTKEETNDNQITLINIKEEEQKIIIEYITSKGKTAKIEVINKPRPGSTNAKVAKSPSYPFNRKEKLLSTAVKVGFFRNNNELRIAATAKELLTELQHKFANKACIVRLVSLPKDLYNENRKASSPAAKKDGIHRTVELENTNTNKQEQQNTASSQHAISPTPFSMVMIPRAA